MDPHDFSFMPPPMDELAHQMPQRYRMPDWMGPRSNWLPGTVALHHVAGRSPDAVVLLSSLRAYPTGFSFDLVARLREPSFEVDQAMFGHPGMGMPGTSGSDGALPDGLLRVALVFADGSSASSLGGHPMMLGGPDGEPSDPVLMQNGGGGGGGDYNWGYWCWPMPPAGDISVVCEWPAGGIAREVTTLPADAIMRAAEQAEQLWEDPPEPPAEPGGPVDVVVK